MIRFALGLIALCLTAGYATAANAQHFPNNMELNAARGNAKNALSTTVASKQFDDLSCERFPKENVFDSFEKALQTPEKVKCLTPTFEGDSNMRRLPPGLATLVNLEVFSFACLEQLEALPEEIGSLSKLEELIIDNGNGCVMNVSIPRSIGKLQNLRVLRLYGAIDSDGKRKIKRLPDTIANLRQLEVLDLGRNGLNALPPQIAALSNLKILRLDYNSLRSVPAFVGNFKNLEELSLNANKNISALPRALSKRKGLSVSMGNNALKLKDQRSLRSRFPRIIFSFENEYDDERANEESSKPKSRTRQKQ